MNEDYSTGGSMIIIERLQDECYKSYLKFLRQCSCVSPGNQQEIKVGDNGILGGEKYNLLCGGHYAMEWHGNRWAGKIAIQTNYN